MIKTVDCRSLKQSKQLMHVNRAYVFSCQDQYAKYKLGTMKNEIQCIDFHDIDGDGDDDNDDDDNEDDEYSQYSPIQTHKGQRNANCPY